MRKQDFLNDLIKVLLFSGIAFIVDVVWVTIELIVYGQPKPNCVDTIVWIVLTWSLYCNLRKYVGIGKAKEEAE